MNKKILSLALGAFTLCSLASTAQEIRSYTQAEAVAIEKCDKPDQCDSKKPCKKDKKFRKDGKCDGKKECVFDKLNLTDEQKTKIQALNQERREARQARCPKNDSNKQCDRKDRKDRKEFRGNRENRDSVMNARRNERIQERTEYLGKLKQILTPEQYLKFLEYDWTTQVPQPGVSGRPGGFRFDAPKGEMNKGDFRAKGNFKDGKDFKKGKGASTKDLKKEKKSKKDKKK